MIRFNKTNKWRFIIWLPLLMSLVIEQAFTQSKSHEQVIGEAYREWVDAANAKDIERWSSFLEPNAIFLPPNNPALNGEMAIKEFYSKSFADERFSLDCLQDIVEISESEDFAWSMGSCEATFTGPDGKEDHGKSKWVKVWKRLSNGEWKCKISSWSSTLEK